ncbi:hypothetical protein [Natrinema altunense]|uniref:Copper resistance protein D domain-containing protein n=1 Tax=Natrinema altunense (strain JCM 12890 / CGMCC 1.3731 / AJ2) TaxID=1227494 RepID=L9ZLB9_NATA2|nr:hypothetical protein [Natrinema altunense]ELY86352.1 hypothetical protein C485_10150 [Natrinema altunense JCM 12890]
MSDPPATMRTTAATDLFDKYVLPKVALVVILAGSLAGTWVSGRLGGQSAAVTLAKWLYFVALGVLTGGLVWKHCFVRPRDLGMGAGDYCAEMYARFDQIATGSVTVLAVTGPVVLAAYASRLESGPLVVGLGVLLAAWLGTLVVTTRGSGPVDEQFRRPAGLFALALALAVVAGTGLAEVSLREFGPIAAAVRTIHLLAFGAWIGGAVWNIFVAVPTGQQRPTAAVARAAGEQLERFRWAVRFIIPLLFLTGLVQAVTVFGVRLETYVAAPIGIAVLAKVGIIGLLAVIFKLCPMWRACSPIDGVCDLEGVGEDEPPAAPTEGNADD